MRLSKRARGIAVGSHGSLLRRVGAVAAVLALIEAALVAEAPSVGASGTVTITAIQGPSAISTVLPMAVEGAVTSPSLNAAFTDTNALSPPLPGRAPAWRAADGHVHRGPDHHGVSHPSQHRQPANRSTGRRRPAGGPLSGRGASDLQWDRRDQYERGRTHSDGCV